LTYDELYEWLDDEGYNDDYDYAVENWQGRTPLPNIISREDYNDHFNLDKDDEESRPAPVQTTLEPEPVFFYEAIDFTPLTKLENLINSLTDE
jgi:hypothetical protein